MRQSSLRLLIALAVGFGVTAAAAVWLHDLDSRTFLEHRNDDALAHYRKRIVAVEQAWSAQAASLRTTIEFLRFFEPEGGGLNALISFLTVSHLASSNRRLHLVAENGAPILTFGGEDDGAAILAGQGEDPVWAYYPESRSLFRVFSLPIWVGRHGRGRMALLVPLDNAFLFENAYPDTELTLVWRGEPLASSLGTIPPGRGADLSADIAATLAVTGLRTARSALLPWREDLRNGSASGGAMLLLTQRALPPFSLAEMLAGGALIFVLVVVVTWLAIGQWAAHTGHRVLVLARAARQFSALGVSAGILPSLIRNSHDGVEDELDQAASAIAGLMEAVEARSLERRKFEQDLTIREEQWRLLLENSGEGIIGIDVNGNCIFVNSACLSILGYARSEDMLGRNIHSLIHHSRPDGAPFPESECPIYHLITYPGAIHMAEDTFWRADGGPVAVVYTAHPILRRGVITGVVMNFSDVSRRRSAERALRAAELRYRTLFEQSPDGIFVLDPDTLRLVEFNDVACRHLGYRRDEFTALSLTDIDHSLSRAEVRARIGRWQRLGHDCFESTFRAKDGTPRDVQVSVQTIDLDGRLLLYCIVHDIAPRRRAEAALIEAKQAAEAANHAKSAFLANMSHEIRTPMNAVLGMLYLLGKTALNSRQREYLDKGASAAQALLTLISDVLDFSKIEAGRLDLEQTDFYLTDVLNRVADLVMDGLRRKPVEAVFHLPPEVPDRLQGDPGRLAQVLINLVGNAAKFTDRGQVVLSVLLISAAAPRDGADGTIGLRFSVRDTGIGMTDEQRARLFQAFSQADTSTTRRFGGTGLGLAISREIVERMGGEITCRSTWGEGSEFVFTARFGVPKDALPVPAVKELPPLQVLVVDSLGSARISLRHLLEREGVKVAEAVDYDQALDFLEDFVDGHGGPLDAVLLARRPPYRDDIRLLRAIHELPLGKPLPVISLVTPCDREEVEAGGAGVPRGQVGDILLKPVTTASLLAALRRALLLGPEESTTDQTSEPGGIEGGGETAGGGALQGFRLLLAEDNSFNQEVARHILEHEGAEVVVAGNGAEAVAVLAQEGRSIDAVLMDLQMPVMDGFEATRRLRADPAQADLPVIAMTANATAYDRRRCLEANLNDHVPKPIVVADLLAVLRRWLPPHPGMRRPLPPPVFAAGPLASAGAPGGGAPGGGGSGKAGPNDALMTEGRSLLLPLTLQSPLGLPPLYDIEGALARLYGNRALLHRLLGEFRVRYGTIADILMALYKGGDRESVGARAHTVKGSAATLGMMRAAAVAAVLETACHDCSGRADIGTLIEQLRYAFAETMASMDEVLPLLVEPLAPPLTAASGLSTDVETPLSPAQVEAISRLGALVEAQDLDALDAAVSLALTIPAIAPVVIALERLDFGSARTLCRRIQADINKG